MKPIQMNVTVESEEIAGFAEQVQEALVQRLADVLEKEVTRAIEKFTKDFTSKPVPATDNSGAVTTGVQLTRLDQASARELRAAYLLGKLPDDGALLIDTKAVSRFLNVSARTVSRLSDTRAMPAPIRLGNKVKWRLREIIEWVEADCPPQKFWQYSEGQGKNTRKR